MTMTPEEVQTKINEYFVARVNNIRKLAPKLLLIPIKQQCPDCNKNIGRRKMTKNLANNSTACLNCVECKVIQG